MGWLITLCILVLLAILPLGASAVYNSDGFSASLIIGPLRIVLFPSGKKKSDAPKKKKVKQDKKPADKPVKKKAESNKSGGSITDFLPLLKIALELLDDFRRKLRINKLEAKIILGGGDPCDLAVNYGKYWTAVGNLMPHLERFLVIQKRDIEIECDFTATGNVIFVHVDLTITLGRILYIAVYHGVRALIAFLQIMKTRKGGASQ